MIMKLIVLAFFLVAVTKYLTESNLLAGGRGWAHSSQKTIHHNGVGKEGGLARFMTLTEKQRMGNARVHLSFSFSLLCLVWDSSPV